MPLERPPHLVTRQISGRIFDVAAILIRITGNRDQHGEWSDVSVETEIKCATAPVQAGDARARTVTEGGIRLDDARLFWTADELTPASNDSPGDMILYAGERWRVKETHRWGGFSESRALRKEGQ